MNLIVLVENDNLYRRSLKKVLINFGYTVIEAVNGKDGFLKSIDHKPDLIIADYKLPDRNGIEMFEAIRKKYPEMDAILMSAHLTDIVSKKAYETGFLEVIDKTIDLNYLETVLKNVLKPES